MIHEEICTYEVAKLARKKGFQLDCIGYYDFAGEFHFNYESAISNKEMTFCHNKYNNIWHRDLTDAPTQSLLQRWLREERGIIVEVFMDDDSNMPLTYNIHQYKDWNWECVCHHHGNYYAINDWGLCLEDALKYALEKLI